LINGEDIVKCIKAQRIKRWGYLNAMEHIKLITITAWNATGIRTKGRPNNRLKDEVIKYCKKPKLRNWIQLVKDILVNDSNDLVE
jgi:hypothetical protein